MPESTVTLVDSHCHIDMPQFDADRDEVVARAREAGVSRDAASSAAWTRRQGHRRALSRWPSRSAYPASAGVHPHEAKLATRRDLRRAARPRARAAHRRHRRDRARLPLRPLAARRRSARSFGAQVRLAREVGLPVIIHTREADDETAALLEEERRGGDAAGSSTASPAGPSWRDRALALGFFISFSGIVAFPRSDGHPGGGAGSCPSTACWSRPTRRSWPRRRIGASATSRPSWSRWRARWRPCAGSPVERDRGGRARQLSAASCTVTFDNAGRIRHFTRIAPACRASPSNSRDQPSEIMADSSFDVVSTVDLQEVKNAIAPGHEGDRDPLRPQGHGLRDRRCRARSSPHLLRRVQDEGGPRRARGPSREAQRPPEGAHLRDVEQALGRHRRARR